MYILHTSDLITCLQLSLHFVKFIPSTTNEIPHDQLKPCLRQMSSVNSYVATQYEMG